MDKWKLHSLSQSLRQEGVVGVVIKILKVLHFPSIRGTKIWNIPNFCKLGSTIFISGPEAAMIEGEATPTHARLPLIRTAQYRLKLLCLRYGWKVCLSFLKITSQGTLL